MKNLHFYQKLFFRMKRHSNFLDTLVDIITGIEAIKIHTRLINAYIIFLKNQHMALLTILQLDFFSLKVIWQPTNMKSCSNSRFFLQFKIIIVRTFILFDINRMEHLFILLYLFINFWIERFLKNGLGGEIKLNGLLNHLI